MKVTVYRLAAVLLALDVVLFAVSGISRFKDAKHGADLVIGEIVWVGFLAGALALLALVGLAISRFARRRRASALGA